MKRLIIPTVIALAALGGCAAAQTPATTTAFSRHTPNRHPSPSPSKTTPAPTPSITTDGSFNGPNPPSGWVKTYSHDFTTAGSTGWTIDNAGATVTNTSKSFGLGFGMTAETNQYAEAIYTGNENIVGPSSWVQGLVYIPAASNGDTSNWPAWWTTGQNWPADGEIDMLEGQSGASCEQTHYGTNGEINSPSNCAAHGNALATGWITVTMLRQNSEVQEWYGNTYIGEVPLPTSADEELIFQNQDAGNGSSCPSCNGPYTASTAWLSNVQVYAP